jgi:hypothetical protein
MRFSRSVISSVVSRTELHPSATPKYSSGQHTTFPCKHTTCTPHPRDVEAICSLPTGISIAALPIALCNISCGDTATPYVELMSAVSWSRQTSGHYYSGHCERKDSPTNIFFSRFFMTYMAFSHIFI